MTTPIDEWKAIVLYHKKQLAAAEKHLAAAEKHLWEQENPVETRPISDAEMKKRVIALETRTAYKFSWKRAVNAGLLDNVQCLVNECYGPWREKGRTNENIVAAVKKLGKVGTLKWQLFTLQIIENLRNKNSFHRAAEGFDTFEDTAGGCDEIVWDAGCDILDKAE